MRAPGARGGRPPYPPAGRALRAVRLFALTGTVLVVVGMTGAGIGWPLLTATLGPTAYVFVAHPDTEAARLRNAVVGHAVAFAAGLAALAAFGLWQHPSEPARGLPGVDQVLASALAVGVTLAVLELARLHHAPAAATAILIGTGLARPGPPLEALGAGIALVIALGPGLTLAWRHGAGARRER